MQPIDIVERVKTTYKNYIKTAFPVIDEGLRAQMRARIDQANLLWRGPYLSFLAEPGPGRPKRSFCLSSIIA